MSTVAETIAATLSAYGTDTFFCLTGGDHDLWIALNEAGIRIVNCRSEASAAYMADGYARVSGKPGLVYGQRGPGAANVAAALADAYWAGSPVISLTTSIFLRSRDRFEYQELDAFELHRPVTKWCKALQVPHRTADMVRAALHAATGPVPGPVHLEVPADMLALDAGPARSERQEALGRVNARRIPPEPEQLGRIFDRLTSARHPLILAGGGVIASEAWEALSRFARATSIPVVTTLGGKGAIADTDPLSVGVIGRYSRRVANETVGDADAVLAIGTQLGGLATHGFTMPLGDRCLMHIDTDPEVLGRNFRTELSLLADAHLALEGLAERAAASGPRNEHCSWAAQIARRVAAWEEAAAVLAHETPDDGIHPAAVLRELRAVMAPDDLLAADTGAIAAWAGTLFPVPAGRNFIRSTGSLGWVVPGAMGAAIAAPGRRTVALTGDGGLLYHIGELETAIRCDIPVVIVVLNNRAFGSEAHLLKHIWGGRDLPEIIDFGDVDFAAVARAFGAHGARVDRREDIRHALEEAYASGTPALVDIRVSKEAEAPNHHFRGDSLV